MFDREDFRTRTRERVAGHMQDHLDRREDHHPDFHFKLLVAIIDRDKTDKAVKILKKSIRRKRGPKMLYAVNATGTASSALLDILGMGTDEREILFYLSIEQEIAELRAALETGMGLKKAGKGIVFALPLSNLCSFFIHNRRHEAMLNWKATETDDRSTHHLMAIIVNEGCGERVIEAAKAAGSRGGTMIKARRINMEESRLFDIPVQLEKEVLLILTEKDKGQEIATALKQYCGMQAEEKGIMFSLAAADIVGLGLE